jgi:hypothetical protein
MLVDLMSTETSDGITLEGAFFAPAQDASRPGPVDAVLLIHGSGGRFYAPATESWPRTCGNRATPAWP